MKRGLKKFLFVGLIVAVGYAVYRYLKRPRDDDWVTTSTTPERAADEGSTSQRAADEGSTSQRERDEVAVAGVEAEAAPVAVAVDEPEAPPIAAAAPPHDFVAPAEPATPTVPVDETQSSYDELAALVEEHPEAAAAAVVIDEPAPALAETRPAPENRFQDSLREPPRAYVDGGDGDVLWRGASIRRPPPPSAGGFFSDAPQYERLPKEEARSLEPESEPADSADPGSQVEWEPVPLPAGSPESQAEPVADLEGPHPPEAALDLPDFAAALGIDPEESIEEKFERFTREQELRRAAELAQPAEPSLDSPEADSIPAAPQLSDERIEPEPFVAEREAAEAVNSQREAAEAVNSQREAAEAVNSQREAAEAVSSQREAAEPVEPEPATIEAAADWRTRAEEFAATPAVASSSLSAPVSAAAQREAESYLDEGNVYFQVGQYQLAVERYNRALEIAPDLVAVLYNRANALTRVGEYDAALADYNRAVELQPADADALNNRGMLHLYRGAYDEALADFTRALAVDPSDTTVLVNRGLALLHNGDAASALDDFQQASQLDPGDAAAQYGAGQASAVLGDRESALGYLEHAFELDPSYAREASADEKLVLLQGDEEFMRLLRTAGSRTS